MQKYFPEALATSLQQRLSPFYLLVGNDLLISGEVKASIVDAARKAEFEEKQEFTLSADTKWDSLFELTQSTGLFFSKQIIILNLPDNLPQTLQKPLAEFLAMVHSDLLIILHTPKLTKTMEKQAWYGLIDEKGVQVNCQTPDISKLPTWLNFRAKSMRLSLEIEASQLLCYSYEGNLLALKQALQMLQLRFPDGKITLSRAKEIVEQSAQFTPFQWVDALLEGKIARAERVLKHLQNEEIQPVVLLRIVQKELMTLLELTRSPQPIQSHQPLFSNNLRAEFDRLKIWQNKRELYQLAIARLTYGKLYRLIQQLAQLEKQVKQEFSDEIWLELARFSSQFGKTAGE